MTWTAKLRSRFHPPLYGYVQLDKRHRLGSDWV